MSVFRAALAGLLFTLSCREAPREQGAPRGDRSEPAAARAVVSKPAPTLPVRRELPAPEAAEPIDPALVPVEEDFRADAERRIDRRSDLELELQRVARELAKRH